MSLRPDDRSSRHRDRSASRSRTGRSRSRSDVREYAVDPRGSNNSIPDQAIPQYGYPYAPGAVTMPSMPPMPGLYGDESSSNVSARDAMMPGGYPTELKPRQASTFPLTGSSGQVPYPTAASSFFPDPTHYDITGASHEKSRYEDSLAYGSSPYPDNAHRPSIGYQQPYPQSDLPPPSPHAFYGSSQPYGTTNNQPYGMTNAPPPPSQYLEKHRTMSSDSTSQRIAPVDPSSFYPPPAAAPVSHLNPSSGQGNIVEFSHQGGRPRASSNLTPHMDRLSISGASPSHGHGGGLPPPSPLLEAYRGTYQSVSPMVAPMVLHSDSDLSDMEPLEGATIMDMKPSKSKHSHKSEKSSSSKSKEKSRDMDKHRDKHRDSSPKARKHVTLYDSVSDAAAINKALSHSHAANIDTATITRILPYLTHDQMLELRTEYKKIAKVNGKGVNLAKHIKLKLTGNYGKVAHVCALGRWESEGYWANFFYQSHSSRRELLIESLMGRSNAEIRAIKDSFRDKRYADDLEKMVSRELRADKFRTAVSWVLEAHRQEETDVLGEAIVRRDVVTFAQCLRTKEGGETAMLEIVVRRSDAHLREVLRMFEYEYKTNFAREALKRSGNLVGEVLAHILNGVINRPARDALLLNHAIKDIRAHNKDEELRYELLISRLVRFHWDRSHLERVKREYLTKYKRSIESDIAEATKSDLRAFLLGLCEPRG